MSDYVLDGYVENEGEGVVVVVFEDIEEIFGVLNVVEQVVWGNFCKR